MSVVPPWVTLLGNEKGGGRTRFFPCASRVTQDDRHLEEEVRRITNPFT